jgi:hypothetical protein
MTRDEQHDALTTTRQSLHGVAELLLAGPQHAASDTVRLRVLPTGFSTVADPDVRLDAGRVEHGHRSLPVSGRTARDLLEGLGLTHSSLADVYSDGSGVGLDAELSIDPAAYDELTRAWRWGDAALRRLAPDQEPVLWPEHFDVGVSVGEVNYGVSPGDGSVPVPYAYVGPWSPPPVDDYWTHSFGAVRPIADLGGEEPLLAFFEEGLSRLGR